MESRIQDCLGFPYMGRENSRLVLFTATTVKGGCIRRIALERDSKQRKTGSKDPEEGMFLACIGVLHV